MARARPAHTPVHRTDLLVSNLTSRKKADLHRLMNAWRTGAAALGHEQWRLFFETGRFNKMHDRDKTTFKALLGNAARVQMCRYAVVGQLQSWLSNRANTFRNVVVGSMLDDHTKHMLHSLNTRKAWFARDPVVMPTTAHPAIAGQPIPDHVRKLARSIMRAVMARHRRPDLSRLSMVLDVRAGGLQTPKAATQKGKVAYWVHLSSMDAGRTFDVPLLGHAFHTQRDGTRTKGIQITRTRDGRLSFGVVTDIGTACEASRAAYTQAADGGAIALDFGLTTLFGTSEGQLLGQGWLKRLRVYDARIQNIARGFQRRAAKAAHGGQGSVPKLRANARYAAAVAALRGFLATEINRVLNRLVAERRPTELVLERLDFRNPTLSRRMNRLVSGCGRAVIQAKLADLNARYGVASTEVNPAYTSQTCSRPGCGYVDKRNRSTQGTFRCLWCGHTQHADLNAARNIGARRASPLGSVFHGKADTLAECVRAFGERKVRSVRGGLRRPCSPNGTHRQRGREPADDPRLANPYFSAKEKTGDVTRDSEIGLAHQGLSSQ